MYTCQICTNTTDAGQRRLVHRIYKTDDNGHKQIDKEVNICGSCDAAIKDGTTTEELNHHYRPK